MTTVLICCADEEFGYVLRQAVESDGTTVVAQALTSHSTLSHLAETEVDVVLVDDTVGPMPSWDLIRQIGSRHPRCGVVGVVADAGAATLATAMEVGARGLLTRPLAVEDVQAKVHAAAAWSQTVRRVLGSAAAAPDGPVGTMVTLAGSKGGVGTTTLATHLALQVMADDPTRTVCLVDLDLQKGDVPNLLDVRHRRDITDLVPVAGELSARALADVLYQHTSGLRILLAPPLGEDGEEVTEAPARQILAMLRSRFDVVIVDAGATVGEASMVAVELSDEVLVVATPDVLGLRGVRRLTGLWERLSVRKEEQVSVILNRMDRRSDIQPDVAQRIIGLPVVPVRVSAGFRGLEVAVNRRDTALADPRFQQEIRALAGAVRLASRVAVPTGRRRRGRRVGGESGQASIELVGMFSLIILLVALIWQGVLVGVTWNLAGNSASEAARAQAVGADPAAAARDSLPAAWRGSLRVTTVPRTGQVRVHLDTPLLLPGSAATALGIDVTGGAVDER